MIELLTSVIAPHTCLKCGREGSLLCTFCNSNLIIYAPRCYKCAQPSEGGRLCRSCRPGSALWALQATAIYEGLAKKLVHTMKYERAKTAAKVIAERMNQTLDLPPDVTLVPVPTASSRVRIRGYDQAVLIGKELSKLSGLPCVQLLQRRGQQRQVGQTRTQRLVQLHDAFYSKTVNEHKNIVLVDDVTTTGATFEVAAACLKAAGAKRVQAIAFAATADK